MLGLGANLSTQTAIAPYSELSELGNYADLDIHFDFSTLTGVDGATVGLDISNLGQEGDTYDIDAIAGTPTLDASTMGLSSVAFDTSEEILEMAAVYTTSGKAFTFFVVIQRADLTNDFLVSSDSAGGTPSVPDDYIKFQTLGTVIHVALQNQTVVGITTSNTNPSVSTTNYTAIADVNMLYVINRNSDGEVAVYSDNGLYIAFKDNDAMKEGATFELQNIGGTDQGTLADVAGRIGEIGLYDADIGAANSITLAKELSTKWGITRDS